MTDDQELVIESLPERDPAELDGAYRPFPPFSEFASTTSVDGSVWASYMSRLGDVRKAGSSGQFDNAVEIAMRSAAIQTGAIEGLYQVDRGITYSIATQAIAWQALKESHGTDIRGHFEAQLAAYEQVLDIATNSREVTQVAIRELHATACAGQATYKAHTPQGPEPRPLELGVYKTLPNHVIKADGSSHSYAPVIETAPEMARLVDELRSTAFNQAHPVVQAAYVHYAFVCIHPFADGNGRVSRALASIYLFRGASMPLVIFADQQRPYYDALEAADGGDYQPFVQFVLARALDTIELVIGQINLARTGGVRTRVASFRDLLTAAGGLTHRDLDSIAERIDNSLEETFRRLISEAGLPTGVSIQISGARNNSTSETSGYRLVRADGHRLVVVTLVSDEPAQGRVDFNVDTLVAQDKDNPATFLVRHVDYDSTLRIRIDEIHPEETELFRIRSAAFAESVLDLGLNQLFVLAQSSLVDRGYPA